ncbi:MAG: metallophosphoesterase family protein [Verrucomicrobia bacterium]|nr:metallophosphoesterase family protein [Verrucomicrobiota bacterium]
MRRAGLFISFSALLSPRPIALSSWFFRLARLLPLLSLAGVGPHPASLWAHVGPRASVHDTVTAVLDRLSRTLPEDGLRRLTAAQALTLLTSAERETLGEDHLRYRVNLPVTVTVLTDRRLGAEPFWLSERGFQRTGLALEYGSLQFDAWERDFPPGPIGLGVNSLGGGGEHYLVLLKPSSPGGELVIDELYPGQLRVADFVPGVPPYADREETLAEVPPQLAGRKLLRTLRGSREDGRLLGVFRWTDYPASERPDQVVLTWSGDPQTSQAIQWRTRTGVRQGYLVYARRAEVHTVYPRRFERVKARTEPLRDLRLLNDPVVHRHRVELTGLTPATTYVYAVGDGSRRGWSEFREFTTAGAGPAPFSFVYMGDAQNGLDRWGSLVQGAFRQRPDAAFYLLAGDLVNRGNQRDDWDSFFHNARGVFDRRPLVPVIGNHECQGGHPTMYLEQFALPRQGPPGLEPERAYALRYRNALLVVLDSNLQLAAQSGWLAQQLATTNVTWKFVAYHHPAYSSTPGRDNAAVRAAWTPLFDQYHVDLVLQGHDHAYLRTYPLKQGQRVASPAEGTVYVVSVSGTKMYEQAARDYTEVGMTRVSTYQVLDLQISGDRLLYRAYDADGALRDQLVIEK